MQLYLPTCTCRNMHPQLYIPTCTHTSGCIKGPLFSLPVVFVTLFAIRIMESLTWRSGLFGPAGEFASEVERLQQSIRCEMSMSIDDGSRNDHVPEISTPNGEEPEPTLAEIVRAMNGQQEVLLNLCRNVSESRTPLPRHSSPIPQSSPIHCWC